MVFSNRCDDVYRIAGRAGVSPRSFVNPGLIIRASPPFSRVNLLISPVSPLCLLNSSSLLPRFLLFASSDSPRNLLFGSSGPEENPRRKQGKTEDELRYHRGPIEEGERQFTVHSLQFTVYSLQFTVHRLQFTICSPTPVDRVSAA